MIALSEWSFHRALFAGEMDHLDFPLIAADLGFDAVEYTNTFFRDGWGYVAELDRRASQAGVENRLVMVDGCGFLAEEDNNGAILRHREWISRAGWLGCPIRVNMRARGEERMGAALRAVDALGGHAVIENHGGLSSAPGWLLALCVRSGAQVLSDFGNWGRHDPYDATRTLLRYTWGFSAKWTSVDYAKMGAIVRGTGIPVSVEYEGVDPDERAGVLRAKREVLEVLLHGSTDGALGDVGVPEVPEVNDEDAELPLVVAGVAAPIDKVGHLPRGLENSGSVGLALGEKGRRLMDDAGDLGVLGVGLPDDETLEGALEIHA